MPFNFLDTLAISEYFTYIFKFKRYYCNNSSHRFTLFHFILTKKWYRSGTSKYEENMGKETRKWVTSKKFPGVRWYQHATRKNGVQFDRCYGLRYKAAGKRYQPTLGWASQGWTEHKAALELAKLKDAYKTGEGEFSLGEKRKKALERRRKAEEQLESQKAAAVTFAEFWEKQYWPAQTHKAQGSLTAEQGLYDNWLSPVIGNVALPSITPGMLTPIKNNMLAAEKAPSTIKYAMALFSQVWNMAKKEGIVCADSPSKDVVLPKIDNRRIRFLTPDESELLLATLNTKSVQVHDMSLLALHCGLRFGEIARLTWDFVDFTEATLTIVDSKNKSNTRVAFMTARVEHMLKLRWEAAERNGLVFPSAKGTIQTNMSKTFARTANELFNEGVTDSRQKVCFHTLRHTFASWLVQRSVDLYSVKELMGHATFKMTQRYSHLSPEGLRKAVGVIG